MTSPRALASLRFTLLTSLAAALINAVFGFVVAWVLARYRFPGKRLVDAIVDLPLALPTAVAGVALTALYTDNGWIGSRLAPLGHPPGVRVAGRRHRARLRRACRSSSGRCSPSSRGSTPPSRRPRVTLGASARQTFVRVVLPALAPALRAGFAAAFARALGEYGSVVFIAGNMPMKTEITSLLIMTKLDQYDYAGAASLGVVMLGLSLVPAARHPLVADVQREAPCTRLR